MPGSTMSAEVARQIYSTMTKIYRVDELLRNALMSGRITVFYFPVRGQEAIAATFAAACATSDHLVSTYRGLHDEIAKAFPLVPLLAELLVTMDCTVVEAVPCTSPIRLRAPS